jgi:hypothetical protein
MIYRLAECCIIPYGVRVLQGKTQKNAEKTAIFAE